MGTFGDLRGMRLIIRTWRLSSMCKILSDCVKLLFSNKCLANSSGKAYKMQLRAQRPIDDVKGRFGVWKTTLSEISRFQEEIEHLRN